ncbi:MAG: hypothetical protein Q9163_002424 [Psora crenata]
MFQRIKEKIEASIDSKIAEEQAKSRFASVSPSRSGSGARRTASRALSPTKRSLRQDNRGRQEGPVNGQDPSNFEPEFVIDDEELSRSGTPVPRPVADHDDKAGSEGSVSQGANVTGDGQEPPTKDGGAEPPSQSPELPSDVRTKLRKLEKLEGRYQELLRSYRMAHARVQAIDSFETSLRENTPLTSINDPNALVEYLNQVNLKSDMVLDELKRVSSERDSYKRRLDEAEKKTKDARDEAEKLHVDRESDGEGKAEEAGKVGFTATAGDDVQELGDGNHLGATKQSPTTSIKSPTVTIPGMSLFSPRLKSTSPKSGQGSEDLFSYDGEIPRLEGELQVKERRIVELESDVQKLQTDLAVARESTQSMVQTLEDATREVNSLRDSKDRSEADAQKRQDALKKVSDQLTTDLCAAEAKLQQLEEKGASENNRIEELNKQLKIANTEIQTLRAAHGDHKNNEKEANEMKLGVKQLKEQLLKAEADRKRKESQINDLSESLRMVRSEVNDLEANKKVTKSDLERALETIEPLQSQPNVSELGGQVSVQHESQGPPAPKRKGKKKRRAGKLDIEHRQDTASVAKSLDNPPLIQGPPSQAPGSDTTGRLQHEIRQLQSLLEEKDAAIKYVQVRLKDQEGLQEEIESLRDDIVNVGQDHVEAKDRVKELVAEKSALERTVMELENELAEARGARESAATASEQKQKDLAAEFDELKVKAATLQTDLSAAQQLASSRFKAVNALRDIVQKSQPEISTLRSEVAGLKSTKEVLIGREADLKRLESRHEEMRNEVARIKQTNANREVEIKSLNELNRQEISNRSKAEDAFSKAQREVSRLEAEKCQAADSLDRVSRELAKVREELTAHKTRLRDVEEQLSKHRSDSEGLKEEIELKSAQYASAQSLMASMRDQTAEMAMQMKEARDRCESLDEEVADAHRLLSERSREGETMRRLLADVEARSDARTRDMKERMDTAIEERDRAEEEASTAGRRRAREVEELRNKCRDLERSLKRAEEDKEELEGVQRDWKRRREELEYRASQSAREMEEVKRAMGELQDSLDERERQARELEKQKSELRRSVEDTQHRLERLQKSNKSMAEEIGKVRGSKSKAINSESQSTRTSMESTARLGSPSRTASGARLEGATGQASAAMDYVYLKNVLLQFLEQKDKKHQMQLIPVLGMLLHFDRMDEQKWMSAITTKG